MWIGFFHIINATSSCVYDPCSTLCSKGAFANDPSASETEGIAGVGTTHIRRADQEDLAFGIIHANRSHYTPVQQQHTWIIGHRVGHDRGCGANPFQTNFPTLLIRRAIRPLKWILDCGIRYLGLIYFILTTKHRGYRKAKMIYIYISDFIFFTFQK